MEKPAEVLTPNISVSRETLERMTIFVSELQRWQKKMNLIGPATKDEIWERHIADTWQIAMLLQQGSHAVDMGSGAGLPGLIIALRLAELGDGSVTLIEANGKKCSFLNHVRRIWALPSKVTINVLNERVQDRMPQIEDIDVVTARAFAPLCDLLEYSVLASGADQRRHVFPKGRTADVEIEDARRYFSFDVWSYPSVSASDSVILELTNLKRL